MADKKASNWLWIILLLGLGLLIIVVIKAPKPVDWTVSFSNRHDIPLGNRLVYSVMPALFPNQIMIEAHSGIDHFLDDLPDVYKNYIIINNTVEMSNYELRAMIDRIRKGSNVFIAGEHFSQNFTDSLGLDIFYSVSLPTVLTNDSVGFNFTHKRLKSANYFWFRKAISNNYFMDYDTVRATVLGYNHEGKTNFLRMKIGEGWLYLNCNPMAFTNYHLLSKNNADYIFGCLSYLPVAPTVWDEYYKTGNKKIVSPLVFVLSNRSLRVAWFVFLIGVLVYFVFESKRRQRPIPVLVRPENKSLAFVQTVGQLYFYSGDHLSIAKKRYLYFVDFLKTRYYINFGNDESRLIEEVALKSGLPERSVASLFKMARRLDIVTRISEEDLQQFNNQLEFFYKNCR